MCVCVCVFFFLLNLYGHLDSSLPCVDPNIYTHTATTTTTTKSVASKHSGKRTVVDLVIRKKNLDAVNNACFFFFFLRWCCFWALSLPVASLAMHSTADLDALQFSHACSLFLVFFFPPLFFFIILEEVRTVSLYTSGSVFTQRVSAADNNNNNMSIALPCALRALSASREM